MAQLDVYRVTREVILDGVRHINVMHFQQTDPVDPTPTPEEALLEQLDPVVVATASVEDAINRIQMGFVSRTKVGWTVQRIQPTLGFEIGRGFNLDSNPEPPQPPLPVFAQAKITFFSDLPGRSGRGGIYLSGLPEARVDQSAIGSSTATNLDLLVTRFLDGFTVGGPELGAFLLGVFSRLLLEFHPVISAARSSTVGTMRSRRVGVGA